MTRALQGIASLSPDAQRQVREQLAPRPIEKAPKFRNVSVVIDGYRFPSKRESLRYLALKAEQARGEIADLRIQPAWRVEHNGVHLCDVVLDFEYRRNGVMCREDVKSKFTKTAAYRLKKKMMLAFFHIDVAEVI